jgi:hypothetical protein
VAGMGSAYTPERRDLGVRGIGWAITTAWLMWAAFLVALALAVIVLVIFGVEERGTAIALRATARWSFLLFWPAYAGGAIAWLWPRLTGLARHGRELGLAYASAQLVHVGLVLWIIHVATEPSGAMVFFWSGFSAPTFSRSFPCRGFGTLSGCVFGAFSARLPWSTSQSPSRPTLSPCTRTSLASIR